MQIVCFEPEVSVPVTDFGSRHKLGPLTGPGARVLVQVVYLPAGGLVGRHETGDRQLFAAVAGSGWVSGQDGDRKDLEPGYGAVWDKGEAHEAGSEKGMTAVCIEGNFDLWAFPVTTEIIVSDYDPEWPNWFEQIRRHVWAVVEDIALRIDHVGSTSVPGLAAKPIIDMDIVAASEDKVGPVTERLAATGYRWAGDLGVVEREAFFPTSDTGLPPHHLYLVVEDNRAHLDHWLLRDLLRDDPESRARYAALKRRNAELARGDLDFYVRAKAALVAELLTRAREQRGLSPVSYWQPDIGG